MELGRFLYELSIDRVLYFPFNSNRDGLIHLVTGNQPGSGLAQISFNHFLSVYIG
jgi:hypothetical protein